jgi:hypothetical protein
MIDKDSVEKYFKLMKSKGFIDINWDFDCFVDENMYLKIYYLHKSGKRSSYRFLKERVLQELREDKLRQLFN